MACPRVFFDITAGGQPVGRIIMEVSFLIFRRNLTIFFRDDITLGVRTNAMFLPVFLEILRNVVFRLCQSYIQLGPLNLILILTFSYQLS